MGCRRGAKSRAARAGGAVQARAWAGRSAAAPERPGGGRAGPGPRAAERPVAGGGCSAPRGGGDVRRGSVQYFELRLASPSLSGRKWEGKRLFRSAL